MMGMGSSEGIGRSWSGNASGTRMGGGVDGTGKHGGRRSLEKVVSLVSESVDHSSEISESAVSSSELPLGVAPAVSSTWNEARSGWGPCLVLGDLFLRNPIRLCGRGGTSGSLTFDMFVNKDLTRAS